MNSLGKNNLSSGNLRREEKAKFLGAFNSINSPISPLHLLILYFCYCISSHLFSHSLCYLTMPIYTHRHTYNQNGESLGIRPSIRVLKAGKLFHFLFCLSWNLTACQKKKNWPALLSTKLPTILSLKQKKLVGHDKKKHLSKEKFDKYKFPGYH